VRFDRFDSVQKLVLVAIPLGLLHHADHVGRADHSSWPFRSEVGPFTFTLLFYPIFALVLLVGKGHWLRVLGLGIVSLATLFAHILVEPPQQIYGTWAHNLSTPAPLYSVDPEHLHNLFNIESPLLGILATALSIILTGLLILAWALSIRDWLRRRPA
jgi:hypothetical protein